MKRLRDQEHQLLVCCYALSLAKMGIDEATFLDQQAQARQIPRNPAPAVAVEALPEPAFRSCHADAKHLAASGDLVALVTGSAGQPR